ncbi:MAG: putative DNA binding domain-containing protein [Candidatus Odinarchaeota archaeon]|nr:putative DNA binding domain-containing protein [Candidatus Odinarchaeota archaeon]
MKRKDSLLKDIMNGESETVEFKKSLSEIREIVQTLSAFANTKGGKIIVGVDDSGNITGVTIGKDTIEKLVSTIIQNTNPRVYPEIFTETLNNKNVIVMSVSERKDKPVFAYGKAYIRIGKNTVVADRDAIIKMIRESQQESYEEIQVGVLQDLNLRKVEDAVKTSAKIGRGQLVAPMDFLKMLQFVDEKPKICAILLFSDNPQKYLPWAVIKVGMFSGSDLIYEKEISGSLFEQVELAYSNVVSLIKKRVSINGLKRKEIYEYPLSAIREAITNAVVHRDYSIRTPIYIKITSDSFTIQNPGGIPGGIDIDDLLKNPRSILRNPKIANMFYMAGYIEKWGLGLKRIYEACIKNGNDEPKIESNRLFTLKIKSNIKGNKLEGKILEFIKDQGSVTRYDIEKQFNIAESTARKYLSLLKNRGLVMEEKIGKRVFYRST